jgi:hypothetical protein
MGLSNLLEVLLGLLMKHYRRSRWRNLNAAYRTPMLIRWLAWAILLIRLISVVILYYPVHVCYYYSMNDSVYV